MKRTSQPSPAPPTGPGGLRLDRIARLFFLICVVLSIWLASSPLRSLADASHRAQETRRQLDGLRREQVELGAQNRDLSKGTGLEEQARRQGLIDPSERSYVIEGAR